MRRTISSCALSIACIIAIAGCDPAATFKSEPTTIPSQGESFSEVIPYGNPNRAALTDLASQHRSELWEQYGSLRAQIIDIIETDGPIQDKATGIDRILSERSTSPLTPYLEQFAAHRILRELLIESSPNAVTVAHYAELLIRNENPDAELLHRALRQLEGVWSDERLAKTAQATSARARKWAERVCIGCVGGKTQEAHNPGLLLKHDRILDAADKLDDFVGP